MLPILDEYLPAAQLTQALSDVAEVRVPDLPLSQPAQALAPTVEE